MSLIEPKMRNNLNKNLAITDEKKSFYSIINYVLMC